MTGIGKAKHGPYYMVPHTAGVCLLNPSNMSHTKKISICIDVPIQIKGLTACSDNSYSWHQRLGHVCYPRMKLIPSLQDKNTQGHDGGCPICPLAKQANLPFPIKINYTESSV